MILWSGKWIYNNLQQQKWCFFLFPFSLLKYTGLISILLILTIQMANLYHTFIYSLIPILAKSLEI